MFTFSDKDFLNQLKNKDADTYEYISHLSAEYKKDLSHGCHDIRNIIALISGNFQLIEYNNPTLSGDPRWKQMGKDIDYLVRSMSDIGKYRYADKVSLVSTDSQEYLWSLQEIVYNSKEYSNLDLVLNIPPKTPQICIDRDAITQIFLSMLKNIVEACDTASVCISSYSYKESFCIEIADNVPHFDSDTLAALFNPFNTSKRDHIGLSLAIAYRVMVAHNGSITRKPNHPQGSIFTLSFPLHSIQTQN